MHPTCKGAAVPSAAAGSTSSLDADPRAQCHTGTLPCRSPERPGSAERGAERTRELCECERTTGTQQAWPGDPLNFWGGDSQAPPDLHPHPHTASPARASLSLSRLIRNARSRRAAKSKRWAALAENPFPPNDGPFQ
ncbi:hypothetical protein H920_11017 [Fukomys damarensis]|uniref:Uncharacterized protein n=1 Tax=Fukomys damarensis TaxID=885580 RepID=A0A091DXS0_FUKDA|nr:hypothetical protein H920_11017 [Fukomys damarensis]